MKSHWFQVILLLYIIGGISGLSLCFFFLRFLSVVLAHQPQLFAEEEEL